MERYIADKLLDYLNKYRVIDNKQYGFQRGKGTVNLLEDFADIINAKLHEEESLCCLKLNAVAAGVRRLICWGGVTSRPSTVWGFTGGSSGLPLCCWWVGDDSGLAATGGGVLAWLERIVMSEGGVGE
ncbi:hypothetical protein Trydic_g15787 [Trypoxylus dichotomus]